MSNDYIVSSSLDGTVRVWEVKEGKCMRTTVDSCVVNACRFHPINTNSFVVLLISTS